ncbi:MAG: hypothetical protein SOR75_11430 [Synergistes jonesii]|uniref:hypothetical protein n=1 Tax=Synergistes jonesii TaxID=2754 RepID=UPI002A761202|nr:hypothetical protein [Synergistes jonesii]MDY2985921.1 hypothetical protein [Synergistes jonesii]
MLKAIRDLFAKKRNGVFLACACGTKEKHIGNADGMARYTAKGAQLRDMDCYGCGKLGRGCWGPRMEVRG